MTDEEIKKTVQSALVDHATEIAKSCLEIYLSDGLDSEDYHYSYQSFSSALLYLQRKRKMPEE